MEQQIELAKGHFIQSTIENPYYLTARNCRGKVSPKHFVPQSILNFYNSRGSILFN